MVFGTAVEQRKTGVETNVPIFVACYTVSVLDASACCGTMSKIDRIVDI